MDFAPLTIFFMVSLLGFHGNFAMPYPCVAPAGTWPEECEGATYCSCHPADYPDAGRIKEILKKSDIDFSKIKPTTLDDRVADNMCRHYVAKDLIYMIKDMADEIRYVVYDPIIPKFQIEIQECHKEQSLGELEEIIQCRQNTTPWKFVVLTADKNGVELADVNNGLPTSCASELINSE